MQVTTSLWLKRLELAMPSTCGFRGGLTDPPPLNRSRLRDRMCELGTSAKSMRGPAHASHRFWKTRNPPDGMLREGQNMCGSVIRPHWCPCRYLTDPREEVK